MNDWELSELPIAFDAPPDDWTPPVQALRTEVIPVAQIGWSDAALAQAVQRSTLRGYSKGLRNGLSVGWTRGFFAGLVVASLASLVGMLTCL